MNGEINQVCDNVGFQIVSREPGCFEDECVCWFRNHKTAQRAGRAFNGDESGFKNGIMNCNTARDAQSASTTNKTRRDASTQ